MSHASTFATFALLGLLAWGATAGAAEHDHAGHAAAPAPVAEQGKKILYYRNPMGLPDVSPTPKKDSMGMDYIPVYEGAGSGPALQLSLDRVQKLGVRTEAAANRRLVRSVRAVGSVQIDESREVVVSPRFEGWIERLDVNTTGQSVYQGQTLLEFYSPELNLVQQEYLVAVRKSGGQPLVEGAVQRLRNWGVSEQQLQSLRASGKATHTLRLESPMEGVVLEKGAVQGMRFMPGEVLYRIADLSQVWVVAELFEQDLGLVAPGQPAQVAINSLPGEVFFGKIDFIYPTLNPETRTAKVRVELPNPDGRLRPALYAIVTVQAPLAPGEVLAIPDSAVLDSGKRQVVLVEQGAGKYLPQGVTLGRRADGYVQVLHGLNEGDKVVVSANFLIDAESNLKAALDAFHPPP